jgi:hypothetical protein
MTKRDVKLTVSGFLVKKYTPTAGKDEEDPGTITLSLIASKDAVEVVDAPAGMLTVGDVCSALNLSQEVFCEVPITLNFKVDEDVYAAITRAAGTVVRPAPAVTLPRT